MSAAGLPLLESKLHVPRRRSGVVPRARLSRDELPPVLLVSAPAGFGKTTLLTTWVGGGPAPVAWVSLDRRDSDPAVFWAYVVAALQKVAPAVGVEALALLHADPSALEAVVALLSNDLAALTDDVVLVLDDLHAIESVDLHESLRFLIEHLPAPLHLVVATRADPPWPLAQLRARRELVEVRAADLRFTADEAAAYLNHTMGLTLDAPDIEALEGRTEGWIAALQLAALSLQGRDDPSAFIAGFAGDDRFVVDYLVDEVLDRQPEDTRAFLLDTSILSRLSAPLAAAVSGRDDARAALDALDRSNLFLVALDDQRRWYRYHHLFADVLRARLADERTDGGAEQHRRASAWFEATDDRGEAIRHALAAGDVDRAADLVELAIPGLRQARQDVTQRAWLDALPPSTFERRPVLMIALVGARMVTSDIAGVEPLLAEVEQALADPGATAVDPTELARVPAQTAMYRAALALLRGDRPGAVEHATRAAALSGAEDHLGRGAAAALVGLARWADGDLAAAEGAYVEAIAAFEAAEHRPDILGCSLALADMQAGQGRPDDAERTLRRALALGLAGGPLRGTADMYVGLAELALERDEPVAAAADLEAAVALGEHLALAQCAHRWRVVAARLRARAGDVEGALALLEEAEARYDTDYSPPVRPVPAVRARVQLAAGDVDGALRWAEGVPDELTYVREYEHLTVARVQLAAGRVEEARALLERLVAVGAGGTAAEARALLASAAAPATTAPTPVPAPAPAPAPATVAAGTATGLIDDLSARERDVLRLLRSELSGPEIARELVVSLNTVRTHTKRIFMKLGVNNRRAAVRRADELGL